MKILWSNVLCIAESSSVETKKLKMIDAYCTDSINYPIPTEAATKGVL